VNTISGGDRDTSHSLRRCDARTSSSAALLLLLFFLLASEVSISSSAFATPRSTS